MHQFISKPTIKYKKGSTRGDVFLTQSWNLLVHLCNHTSHRSGLLEFGQRESDLIARAHIWWENGSYKFQWASGDISNLPWEVVRDCEREIERRLAPLTPEVIEREKERMRTQVYYSQKRAGKKKHQRRYYAGY